MTDDHQLQLTRRSVLAGLGALGAATAGSRYVAAATGGRAPYNHYTYAQTTSEQVDLRVAWYETYNGSVVERTPGTLVLGNETTWTDAAQSGTYADADGTTDSDHGPAISVTNVLPGDRGTLVVGLFNEGIATDVWLQLEAGEFLENGLTEPESVVDATPEGELGDAIDLRLWSDVGVGGVGACNGVYDLDVPVAGDTFNEPLIASGTLREVSEALAGGVRLDTTPRTAGTDCVGSGEQFCIGLEWSIDQGVGNAIQSDSATFDLRFAAVECGSEGANPFATTSTASTGGGGQ